MIKFRRYKKKLSGKCCLVFLEIQALRKWSLRDSMSISLIFNSNHTFFWYCNSQCPNFENLCTLLTINKTDKYREKVNATSQSYQDGINLPEYLTREEKNNGI